jgi:LacI family transcriptional regulator
MGRRRVALLIESSRKVGREVLGGIAAYAAKCGPWEFCHYERPQSGPPPRWLRQWKPDGIIGSIDDRELLRRIAALRVPTVDTIYSLRPPLQGTSRIFTDQRPIAMAAADHLLNLGFEQFAFCGYSGIYWSDSRQRRFAEYLAGFGRKVIAYQPTSARSQAFDTRVELDALLHTADLVRWVRDLPRPIGLMACNDVRARQVLTACDEAGIAVPDEIAVVGVDNDEVVCMFCNPPLSSIDQDVQRLGYEAAAMLDRLMRGKSCPQDVVLDLTVQVQSRASTNVLAVADPELREVVRYIRDHACEGLTLDGLVERFSLSRSTLQRWFARHVRRSPSDEIDRVRLDRIKELMTATDLPLSEIAYRSGFEHFESMHRLFKTKIGTTPSEYRNSLRVSGAKGAVSSRLNGRRPGSRSNSRR